MIASRPALALALAVSLGLAACGKDEEGREPIKAAEVLPVDVPAVTTTSAATTGSGELPDMTGSDETLSAVIGASDIPYPVYPNGTKYRIGGENGLKVVLFETEDSFDTVDEYYAGVSSDKGMPRLAAMNDYVRYSNGSDDQDPWATSRPGIVIHQFKNDDERAAVGARSDAKTNIIMSF